MRNYVITFHKVNTNGTSYPSETVSYRARNVTRALDYLQENKNNCNECEIVIDFIYGEELL